MKLGKKELAKNEKKFFKEIFLYLCVSLFYKEILLKKEKECFHCVQV